MTENGAGPSPAKWREYIIQVPELMGTVLNHKLDEQTAMENRAISQSEFLCWLLDLGLAARAQLLAEHQKSEQRILRPGDPGFTR